MARNKNVLKRYWPIVALAGLVAERAHAPSIPGAHAADKTNAVSGQATPATDKAAPDATKSAKPNVAIPPGASLPGPSAIEKTLKDLQPPADSWMPWDLSLASDQAPDQSGSVDLLSSTDPMDNPALQDGLGLGSSSGTSGDIAYTPPSPVGHSTQFGDDGFDFGAGANPVANPTSVPAVAAARGITVTQVAAVPEPGMMPVVVGALAVLGCRKRRRIVAAH